MLAHLNGECLTVESSAAQPLRSIQKSGIRANPDINALATLTTNHLAILIWNYHDDDVPAAQADINLAVNHLPHDGAASSAEYPIDETHTDPSPSGKKWAPHPIPPPTS